MRTSGTLFAAALLLILSSSSCLATSQPQPTAKAPADTVTLLELINAVQAGLGKAQDSLTTSHLPPLKSVTLTLQTVASGEAGGSVNVLIFQLGGDVKNTQTALLTITLVVPQPGAEHPVSATSDLTDALVNAIKTAAAVSVQAATGPLRLHTQAFDFEFAFSIVKNGNGGLTFKILTAGASASGKKGSEAVQKVKVSFGEPQKTPTP